MFESTNTFFEEMETIGKIPGLLATAEEASNQGPPTWPIIEFGFDRIWPEGVADDQLPSSYERMRIPGYEGLILDIPLDWVEMRGGSSPAEFFEGNLGIDIEAAVAGAEGVGEQSVASAAARLGTDAFAVYLPWHKYANSRHTPWGMWFFLEPLVCWAAIFKKYLIGSRLAATNAGAFNLAFYVAYRHEQFHFHVERFATRQEVLSRKPVYLPYDTNVFYATNIRCTEHWLEEALAQAVVLESTFLSRRVGISTRVLRPLIEAEFRRFGPGYRDFECRRYGGPEEAHRLLAAQVVSASVKPGFLATGFTTPKKEYATAPRAVPGYVAFKPSFVSRFQLAMPSAHRWPRYAKINGFEFVGPGPGDHEIWAKGRQRVHINCHGKELDRNSVKAVAEVLGTSLRLVVEGIRAV